MLRVLELLASAPELAPTLNKWLKTWLGVLAALSVLLGFAPVDGDAAADMPADGDVEGVPLEVGVMVVVSVDVGVIDALREKVAPASASAVVGTMDWVWLGVMLSDTLGIMLALAPTLNEGVAALGNDGLGVGDADGVIDDDTVPEEVLERVTVSVGVG